MKKAYELVLKLLEKSRIRGIELKYVIFSFLRVMIVNIFPRRFRENIDKFDILFEEVIVEDKIKGEHLLSYKELKYIYLLNPIINV
jgi:hypothetical protein